MPLQISTIYPGVWYNVGMRYLLLILTLTSVCYSADAEVVPGYKEAETAHMAEVAAHMAEITALNNAWEAREKAYIVSILPLITAVPIPALSADPKASELKARDGVYARNSLVREMPMQANSGGLLSRIFSIEGRFPQSMPKLPAFGPTKQAKVDAETIGKPKEKKPITAVLADGTKIE